jgi:hypothetical protein
VAKLPPQVRALCAREEDPKKKQKGWYYHEQARPEVAINAGGEGECQRSKSAHYQE